MAEQILVTKSSLPPIEEYINEIKDIWETHWLTNMGDKHDTFKNMLTQYLDVDNIELLVNGHMAIEMTLQAFGFPKGSEVITTPFTFASTTHAIVRNELVPVFCDINLDDYTMDVSRIEELITDKTVAILPVHVYGNVCEVEEIDRIAKKYNLKVIYDAAHAFGESYKGKSIAMYGDASCFSFHATKVFNSIEGGAVCFRDARFGEKLYRLKNFGIRNEETVDGIGANAKMNEFCAAMGICNLRHLDSEIEKRKFASKKYDELLSDVPGITIKKENTFLTSNYSYYPIIVDSEKYGMTRDSLYECFRDNNIKVRKYFYPLTSEFDCYKGKFDSKKTSNAYLISKNVLTLPMYADLLEADVNRICEVISDNAR